MEGSFQHFILNCYNDQSSRFHSCLATSCFDSAAVSSQWVDASNYLNAQQFLCPCKYHFQLGKSTSLACNCKILQKLLPAIAAAGIGCRVFVTEENHVHLVHTLHVFKNALASEVAFSSVFGAWDVLVNGTEESPTSVVWISLRVSASTGILHYTNGNFEIWHQSLNLFSHT